MPSTPCNASQSPSSQGQGPHELFVVGAGVAGLATALVLAQAGHPCTVFERRDPSAFAGMGFLLMPNGYEALCTLLGSEEASKLGLEVHELTLLPFNSSSGFSTPGVGQRAMFRPTLIERLMSACHAAGVTFKFDMSLERCELKTAEDESSQIELSFTSSSGLRHVQAMTYLIGADGVRSSIRQTLFPNAQLSQPQLTEFVGLSPCSLDRSSPVRLMKVHDHERALAFGWMPINEGQRIWYAQMRCEASIPLEDGAPRKRFLLNRYQGWPQEVISLLSSCPFERTYRWDTYDLLPLERCSRAGALLVGDAAHASLPISSQGVSGALEDAVTLKALLKAQSLTPQRLTPARWAQLCEAFERARSPIWRARYQESHALEARFLSGLPFSSVPSVDT